MDIRLKIDILRNQLDRILGFFPRVDSKASVILAVDTGMLAILVANAPSFQQLQWPLLVVLIPLGCLGKSIWHLYQGAFPSLDGGHRSLIYFREIARRTESQFMQEFNGLSEEQLSDELLSQVWRNSEILTVKFNHIHKAFNWLAWSILPWVVSLAILVFSGSGAGKFIIK